MKQEGGIARRLLVDVGLGLAIIAVIAVLFAVTLITGRTVPFPWVEFVGTTPIVFWLLVKQFRRHWPYARFWLATAGLLAVHVALFSTLLIVYPEWPGIWFVPVFIVEFGFLFLALDRLADRQYR